MAWTSLLQAQREPNMGLHVTTRSELMRLTVQPASGLPSGVHGISSGRSMLIHDLIIRLVMPLMKRWESTVFAVSSLMSG
jgi:hypothetical protein